MMKHFLIFAIASILAVSCATKETPMVATIRGVVKSGQAKQVKFEWMVDNPISGTGEYYQTDIDSSSNFSMEIPLSRLTNGRITVGRYYHEICLLPGDNFSVTVDGDSIAYSGEGAEKNNFLYATEKNGVWTRSYYKESNKGKLSPAEFVVWLKDFKQKRLDFLNSFENYNLLEPEFVNFFKVETQVAYEDQIREYPRRYAYMNKTKEDSLQLPDEYQRLKIFANFVDDQKVISSHYIHYLNNFLYQKSKEVISADTSLTPKDFYKAINIIMMDSLKGKTQEYLMAKWIVHNLSQDKYDTIAIDNFSKIEKDELSATTVDAALNKYNEKHALIGQPLHPAFAATMVEDSTGTQISFAEMMEKYKGQVVYLDIWGLNCGPCRAAMPNSKILKEKLADQPIAFVYIAQDPPAKDVWKKIFDVTKNRENQYRMVKSAWGSCEMLKFMEINWVPCYMIFDKQGHLLDFNADGPWGVSDKYETGLEKTLKKLATS